MTATVVSLASRRRNPEPTCNCPRHSLDALADRVRAVLDTTEGTIAWRVHEARRQIRIHMERLQKEPTPVHIRARARRISQENDAAKLEQAILALLPDPKPRLA